MSVEDLLRVYAPDVLKLAPLLVERKRQLDNLISLALEDHYREGGAPAVSEYLDRLERAQAGVEHFRSELAQFISAEFPLG